jgi:hypothetical protein
MKWTVPVCVLLGALLLPAPQRVARAEDKDADDFKPMFNGKDLKGWVNVNNAPGTFSARDNEIVTTGLPMGYLRTDRMYENFILELEWKHIPPKPGAVGNSGVFVWADPVPAVGTPYTRGIEVQVLVNLEWKDEKTGKPTATSQGDLFSIWGATCVPDRPHPLGWARCIPSENRCKGEGEWNHYRVEAKDGVIKLAVNGKVVSGVSKCKPRKGYLGLEAEGSECHFRNLKIKELPTSDPKPEEICDEAKGFTTMFTGLDLSGWKADDASKTLWKPNPGPNTLNYTGDKPGSLATAEEYGDFEMTCDVRPSKKGGTVSILPRGSKALSVDIANATPGKFTRFVIHCKGNKTTMRQGTKELAESSATDAPARGPIQIATSGPVSLTNLFIRELK